MSHIISRSRHEIRTSDSQKESRHCDIIYLINITVSDMSYPPGGQTDMVFCGASLCSTSLWRSLRVSNVCLQKRHDRTHPRKTTPPCSVCSNETCSPSTYSFILFPSIRHEFLSCLLILTSPKVECSIIVITCSCNSSTSFPFCSCQTHRFA